MTANPSRLIFRPTIHVYHVRPPNSSSKTLTSLHLHLISLSSPISVLPPLRIFRHQSFFSATSRSRPFSSLSSSPERHTPNPSSSVNATSSPSGALSRPPISDVRPKIDANPPKGTRDFPPEEMRLRTWLFQNFRDVSCSKFHTLFRLFWILVNGESQVLLNLLSFHAIGIWRCLNCSVLKRLTFQSWSRRHCSLEKLEKKSGTRFHVYPMIFAALLLWTIFCSGTFSVVITLFGWTSTNKYARWHRYFVTELIVQMSNCRG